MCCEFVFDFSKMLTNASPVMNAAHQLLHALTLKDRTHVLVCKVISEVIMTRFVLVSIDFY